EIWKYGERAYRYCNHDVGHAVAALSCSGAALGWRVALLDALSDEDVAALLGLDREQDRRAAEIAHPDLLAAVAPANAAAAIPNGLWMDEDGRTRTDTDVAAVVRAVAGAVWTGAANRLSADHVPWDIIETVTTACRKPRTGMRGYAPPQAGSGGEAAPASGPSARRIFQQRRSAVDMDGATGISAAAFYRILERTMPDAARPPWWSVAPEPRIHLGLFVHRVTGLPLGLYLLARDPGEVGALREAMRGRSGQAGTPWLWKKPEDAPAALPLFCLDTGDYRRAATEASCHQDIAGDGAFCVTMFARMDDRAADSPGGPWRYPRLFWEAGMVGQVLYLEAERAGVRGTGIGCYFDDVVHACFGLRDQRYQSLYHFTIGGPVEDPRLRSLPPYKRDRRETPAGVIESS
ncbi:MAG TPA: hypothetical protein PKL84_17360, partial [Candidatus Hydrogenedentes bacterium]|nr:hypothetical protein [Candidatus Hydrogenedentota bacterium]